MTGCKYSKYNTLSLMEHYLYDFYPISNGIYLNLIIWWICRRIVRKNRKQKYMSRIGQKTGISKASNEVHNRATHVAQVQLYQNLNSGRRRINGRNSSSFLLLGADEDAVGRWGVSKRPPPSISSLRSAALSKPASSLEGTNLGDKKSRKMFNR